MSHYLVTAHDKAGRITQLAVEIDERDRAAVAAVKCASKASSRTWWRTFLSAAGWEIDRVSSVKPLAGMVLRERRWYESR